MRATCARFDTSSDIRAAYRRRLGRHQEFAGGLRYDDGDADPAVVATDGMVTDGPYPESKELIGGVTIVDVPTREAALNWAAKIAVACRCAQDVRKFLPDPAV